MQGNDTNKVRLHAVRQRLDKCEASIAAHIARGGTRNSARGLTLEIRYDGLRFAAQDSGEWQAYCAANNLDIRHVGFDML